MINQTNFKFMEKKILYHIGLYGGRNYLANSSFINLL